MEEPFTWQKESVLYKENSESVRRGSMCNHDSEIREAMGQAAVAAAEAVKL